MIDLATIEQDLIHAYRGRLATRRRRARMAAAFVTALATAVSAAVAIASNAGFDLQLDPTKWTVLGGGSVDGGRGSFVHARHIDDGSASTFMVGHDDGLAPYEAFLLYERTKSAADASSPVEMTEEPGPICTPEQLSRAEAVALRALATNAPVDTAIGDAFAAEPCKGLDYAGERARFVWAGEEPRTQLMPGAR
jgi:hypothetical protein